MSSEKTQPIEVRVSFEFKEESSVTRRTIIIIEQCFLYTVDSRNSGLSHCSGQIEQQLSISVCISPVTVELLIIVVIFPLTDKSTISRVHCNRLDVKMFSLHN